MSERKLAKVTIVPNIQTQFSVEQKGSLFETLPENTIIWIKDLAFTLEILNQCFDNAVALFEAVTGGGKAELDEPHHFFSAEPSKTFEKI